MSILYSKEADDTMNVAVSGKVTREPELRESTKGNKVRFSIAYGKSKYMECEVWADSPIASVAGGLERGDIVMVAGTHRKWDYNGKTNQCVTADAIFVPPVLPVVSGVTPDAQDMVAAGNYQEIAPEADGELPF